MALALARAEARPLKLRAIPQQPPVQKWQDELDFFQQELAFYRRLLRMGLHNGSELKKSLIYGISEGFSNCEDALLPELRMGLAAFSGTSEGGAVLAFQQRMESLRNSVQELKNEVFPLVAEFQKITIW